MPTCIHNSKILYIVTQLLVILNIFAHLSTLVVGHPNNTHPLEFVTGSQGSNLNILNHDDAMKAVDLGTFEISIAEKLDKLWENKIYGIIKNTDVLEGHKFLIL